MSQNHKQIAIQDMWEGIKNVIEENWSIKIEQNLEYT